MARFAFVLFVRVLYPNDLQAVKTHANFVTENMLHSSISSVRNTSYAESAVTDVNVCDFNSWRENSHNPRILRIFLGHVSFCFVYLFFNHIAFTLRLEKI